MDHAESLSLHRRIWIARGIAVLADAVQLGLFPIFAEGVFSPFNDALDIAVALVLSLLLGFHIAFLPSFLIEQIPFANLAPTWTLAVLIATRKKLPTNPAPTT